MIFFNKEMDLLIIMFTVIYCGGGTRVSLIYYGKARFIEVLLITTVLLEVQWSLIRVKKFQEALWYTKQLHESYL